MKSRNTRHAALTAASSAMAMLLAGCGGTIARPDPVEAQQQVTATEKAFARTMADRDHAAFRAFLADETVFFAGQKPLRGKQAVADAWKSYFDGPEAPFSWEPDTVEVLESGTLALSSGPVRDPQGRLIARFNSIWRRENAGTWRIVFDKGSEVCNDGEQ